MLKSPRTTTLRVGYDSFIYILLKTKLNVIIKIKSLVNTQFLKLLTGALPSAGAGLKFSIEKHTLLKPLQQKERIYF